jgi:shikimate kinase
MLNRRKNVVLIGMPGAGKSTIGVLLAKSLSKDFIDTDLVIQQRYGMLLQEIVDTLGYLQLRRYEEDTILSLPATNSDITTGTVRATGAVIATGGSAVYSERAMRHLQKNGLVVFLQVAESTLLQRIDNFESRGLAKAGSQSFDELFSERKLLYEKYGELVIGCDGKRQEEILREIIGALGAEAA